MTRLQGSNTNRQILVLGTLIAAVLIAVAIFAVRGNTKATADAKNANFNTAGLPYIGKEDAPVQMVIIEDFKCPACKNFEDTIAGDLRAKYVETGKVKWYSLVFPFISTQVAMNPEDDSKYAAMAARCAFTLGGNDAFQAYKMILFRAQGPESEVWASKTRLKDLAQNLDVDQAKFGTCVDTEETKAAVEADKKQVEDAGVRGTPTVFVNGKLVTNAAGEGSYLAEDIGKAIDAAAQ